MELRRVGLRNFGQQNAGLGYPGLALPIAQEAEVANFDKAFG